MAFDWSAIFENYGVKTVTWTDKNKSAYVPSEDQKRAIAAAGFAPESGGGSGKTIDLHALFDARVQIVEATYYDAVRTGSGRTPETRMGRGIVSWISVGDRVLIGNQGNRLFVAKINKADIESDAAAREIAKKTDKKKILKNARKAVGKPSKKDKIVSDFVRNQFVVAGAIVRADGKCEIPGCVTSLFNRVDGTVFLEVHHIVPLAEGGDDTLLNAAALCPMCHRELHYGAKRLEKRKLLEAAIRAKEP